MTNTAGKLPPGTIHNIKARLMPGERSFRKLLLIQIIQTGQPVSPESLAEPASLSFLEVKALVDSLQAKGLLV